MVRSTKLRTTLASKLFSLRGKLCLLLISQHGCNLGHHFRARNIKLDLDLRFGLGRGADRSFVERTIHRIRLVFSQSPHLIEESLVALSKAVLNFLNLCLLVLSQIQIDRKSTRLNS